MDPSLSHTFVQEVVPVVVVLLAGVWLLRRWMRPSQAGHGACAGCDQVAAPPSVRHRLTVLR